MSVRLVVVDSDSLALGEWVPVSHETDIIVDEERLGAQPLRSVEIHGDHEVDLARRELVMVG
jgi:hypothetical protein